MLGFIKNLLKKEPKTDEQIFAECREKIRNDDEYKFNFINSYLNVCVRERLSTQLMVDQKEVSDAHLTLWNTKRPQFKNEDMELEALYRWHRAHEVLSDIYCFNVTYPLHDPRFGQIKEQCDLRPTEWLKDLAEEANLIKHLELKAKAKEYTI